MKHQFREGEKEAVAAILGVSVSDMPDTLDLGGISDDPSDEDEDEDEDDDEDESDDSEDDEDDDDEDEEDEEDKDEEDAQSDALMLKLKSEWELDYAKEMPFSEFLKSRGK